MDISLNRSSTTVMSPFGRKKTPFKDTGLDGKQLTIAPGNTLPELARMYYGTAIISPFTGRFSFLDRDNKERVYHPGIEDPFIFSSNAGVEKFKKDALRLLQLLCDEWKALGFPLIMDEKRGVNVPDSSKAWDALSPKHPLHSALMSNIKDVMFIVSNADIMKKACIVRGVIPGWWAQSYAGKYSSHLDHFRPAITTIVKAIHFLERTNAYKGIRATTAAELSDPLDTNVGYPLFSAQIDKAGNPIAKLKVLQMFKNMGTKQYSLKMLTEEVNRRSVGTGCEGYPFLIAPIRRLQPGRKANHVFRQTSIGLESNYDEWGNNSIRIAWMAPYLLNLYLSPLQLEWKTVRKLMPGLFHDGPAKKQRLNTLRQYKPLIAEADYSNYDRFLPINIFMEFVKQYLSNKDHKDYWMSMCYMLHHGLPMVWPDYIANTTGRGWAFYPKKIGLLSGLKITSEEGTFINNIVCCQSLLDTGMYTEQSLFTYLTQYASKAPGSSFEHFHIQSDDTLIMAKTAQELLDLGNAFKANAERAGLGGSLEIGDRFLMRHTIDGRDTPVPSRVWQNTLSNEEPYDDPLKFLAGLAMRTDGLLGHKTYDPFATAHLQTCSQLEINFTLNALRSIKEIISSASKPQRLALEYLDLMISAGDTMLLKAESSKKATMSAESASKIDEFRKRILMTLSQAELEKLANQSEYVTQEQLESYVYQLHKDSNSPSSKFLLEQLLQASPGLTSAMRTVSQKEQKFYRYAMDTIGIPIQL